MDHASLKTLLDCTFKGDPHRHPTVGRTRCVVSMERFRLRWGWRAAAAMAAACRWRRRLARCRGVAAAVATLAAVKGGGGGDGGGVDGASWITPHDASPWSTLSHDCPLCIVEGERVDLGARLAQRDAFELPTFSVAALALVITAVVIMLEASRCLDRKGQSADVECAQSADVEHAYDCDCDSDCEVPHLLDASSRSTWCR